MTRAWVRRSVVATLALSAATALLPRPARGQFRAPCEVQCALTLGATAYVAGTSALVAWGRASGGVSTSKEAALVWGTGFAIVAGGGVALGGNGARQERAIYGAGLGTLAGTVAGLKIVERPRYPFRDSIPRHLAARHRFQLTGRRPRRRCVI